MIWATAWRTASMASRSMRARAALATTFIPISDAELYRRAWSEAGHAGEPRVAINTHAFVADSRQAADRAFASGYLGVMNRIGRERGWPPSGRAEYDALAGPAGPLAVGSPEEVAEKIVHVNELFQPERYLAHISIGAVEHRDVMHAIELFGTRVAPLVEAAVTVAT